MSTLTAGPVVEKQTNPWMASLYAGGFTADRLCHHRLGFTDGKLDFPLVGFHPHRHCPGPRLSDGARSARQRLEGHFRRHACRDTALCPLSLVAIGGRTAGSHPVSRAALLGQPARHRSRCRRLLVVGHIHRPESGLDWRRLHLLGGDVGRHGRRVCGGLQPGVAAKRRTY